MLWNDGSGCIENGMPQLTASVEPSMARLWKHMSADQRAYDGFPDSRILANLTYNILRQSRMMQTGMLYSSLIMFLYNPPSEMMFMSLNAMMASLKRKMVQTTAISHLMRGMRVVPDNRCSRLRMLPINMVPQPSNSVVNAVEHAWTTQSVLKNMPIRFAPAVPSR